MNLKSMFRRALSGLLSAAMVCSVAAVDMQTAVSAEESSSPSLQAQNTLLTTASEDGADDAGVSSQYFGVSEVVIGETSAEVSYHAATSCTIVLGFYDDAGTTLLTSCQQEVSATESSEDVSVSIPLPKNKPAYFLLKAFILGDNQIPLSTNYATSLYTKGIAEIQDTEISDFTQTDLIVNLDGNEDTNFIVLAENTIRIPYDGKNNLLTSYDKESGVYVFSNANAGITGLKAGDVVFTDSIYLDDMALFKVADVEVSGKTATVTTAEMELNEAVELVKMDRLLSYGEVNDPVGTDYGDGVIFEGTEETVAPVSYSANKLNGYIPPLSGESGSFTKSWRFKVKGNESGGFQNDLNVRITLPVEYTFYWSEESSFNVVSMFPEVFLDGDIKLMAGISIPIRGLKVKNPLNISNCEAFIGVRLEGAVFGQVCATVSERIVLTSDAPYAVIGTPSVSGDFKPEGGSAFIGLTAEVNMKQLLTIPYWIRCAATAGVRAKGMMTGASETHACTSCFDGEMYAVASATIDFELKKWYFEKKGKLFDFYYSHTYYDWGFGDCPYAPMTKDEGMRDEYEDPVPIDYPHGGNEIEPPKDENGNSTYYFKYPSIGEFKLFDDSHARIDKLYAESSGVIPETIDGYLVTEWGPTGSSFDSLTIPPALASRYYLKNHCGSVDNVILSGNPTYIINSWASNSTGIKSIQLPNSITVIGSHAFSSCRELESINIPGSVTSIGPYAFAECRSLTGITLPGSLTHINSYLFQKSGIESFTIPASVIYIGYGAFEESNLKSISVPDGVYLSDRAFYGCQNLESATLGNVKLGYNQIIGSKLFTGCTNLKTVTIPDYLICADGAGILRNLPSLESVAITASGKSNALAISGAFANCTNLKSVTIPNTIKVIYDSFSGCTNLTSITIPHSVTNAYGIRSCPNLSDVYYQGTEREWKAIVRHNSTLASYLEKNNVTVHCQGSSNSFGSPNSDTYFDSDDLTEETFNEFVPDTSVENTETNPSDSVITMGEQTHIVFENLVPGADYVLIAIADTKKSLLDSGNLRYIDQQTADANGRVEFIFADLPEDTIYILSGDRGDGDSFRYEGTLNIEDRNIAGDVNLDGVFSVLDVVILQKWLLGAGKLNYWQHCDFNEDGVINVFDLVLMKRTLLEKL